MIQAADPVKFRRLVTDILLQRNSQGVSTFPWSNTFFRTALRYVLCSEADVLSLGIRSSGVPKNKSVTYWGYRSWGGMPWMFWDNLKFILSTILAAGTAESPTLEEDQETTRRLSAERRSLWKANADLYANALAKELGNRLLACSEGGRREVFLGSLARNLKEFAYRIGYHSTAKKDRDIMYFVYRFRSYV